MTKKRNTFFHMVQGFPHPLSVLEDYIAMTARFPRYYFCMRLFGWILTLNSRYCVITVRYESMQHRNNGQLSTATI